MAEPNEITKLTEEEIQAEKTKAVDEATADLKKQLADKEEELSKLKDKDFNFGKVRKSEEEKEKEIGELKKQIADLGTRITGEHKSDLLKVLAGSDEDLKKTIEFHYDRIKDPADTKEDIEKKLRDAYLLATGGTKAPDAVRSQQSAASGASSKKQATDVDPEVKEWANEFSKHGANITEDDLKKHAK